MQCSAAAAGTAAVLQMMAVAFVEVHQLKVTTAEDLS
jgi:hypothetical protein